MNTRRLLSLSEAAALPFVFFLTTYIRGSRETISGADLDGAVCGGG